MARVDNDGMKVLTQFSKTIRKTLTLDGYGNNPDIMSINVIRKHLREDIAALGWKKIKKPFTKSIRNAFGTQWYAENSCIAKVFEIEEYLGYERSILDLLRRIKSSPHIDDLTEKIETLLITKLIDQVEQGGNTIHLDIEKFQEGKAARLVPIILEKRKFNFLEAMANFRRVYDTGYWVDDLNKFESLFASAYGFSIITAIEKDTEKSVSLEDIALHLITAHEDLLKDSSTSTQKHSRKKTNTPWGKLCFELIMDHLNEIGSIPFHDTYFNTIPRMVTTYKSGYRDIYKALNEMVVFSGRLANEEYELVKTILRGFRTRRGYRILKLIRTNAWKEKYL